MTKFKLTQTALKELEDFLICPKHWYEKWIKKTFKTEPNIHMLRGSYFEYLAIGAGATDDAVTDLPRLKKDDKKSISQIRIEEQAEKFKSLFSPDSPDFLGYHIGNIQIHLSTDSEKGTLDFDCATPDGEEAIVDLKLTGDIFNPHGKWHPLTRDEVDYLQQVHYQNLWFKNKGSRPPAFMAVFDYSTKKNWTFFEVEITEADVAEVEERFIKGHEQIKAMKPTKVSPSDGYCAKCPLKCNWRIAEYEAS